MSNKVTVNIFGQEYTIAGVEAQDKILQVASWVDSKMREIDDVVGSALPMSSLSVLAAVNIANDYFSDKEELEAIKKELEQLKGESKHYMQLWKEAKKNFAEYKEENMVLQQQKEQLMMKYQAKEKEVEKVIQGQGSIKEEIQRGVEAYMTAAEMKYKDLENNFFDLQMENIRMKSELEKLRGGIR